MPDGEPTSPDSTPERCPVCGEGTLTDITFDEATGSSEPVQTADSRQVSNFSCGHRVQGTSLATADEDHMDVERRRSDETVDPPVSEP